MTELPATATPATKTDQPRPARPWQQAGHPLVRVEATADTIYPYALQIGDHATTRIPMTAAALRSLRDALTALLAHTTPAAAEDFVNDWATAHGAMVVTSPQIADVDVPDAPSLAVPSRVYVMAA
ncbi:hypothetical protein AB0F81_01455 [Actinoplanes sp. NPDC024001]|uniref:hypothetical protein n=1 Tax=unclassified Actinoplanes TaxID=2626549 RepID=UPI002E1AC85A